MNSSIIILDSDEDIEVSEVLEIRNTTERGSFNSSFGLINNSHGDLDHATTPVRTVATGETYKKRNHEDSFLQNSGLPKLSITAKKYTNNQSGYVSTTKPTNVILGDSSIVCLDEEDDISNIHNYPSSPKQNSSYIIDDESDDEIIINNHVNTRPKLKQQLSQERVDPFSSIASPNPPKNKPFSVFQRNQKDYNLDISRSFNDDDSAILLASSSLGSIKVPKDKPVLSHEFSKWKSGHTPNSKIAKNILHKDTTPVKSKSTVSIEVPHRSFSDITDYSSSLHDVSMEYTNADILKRSNEMKRREKQKMNNVKSIISDLKKARTGNVPVSQNKTTIKRKSYDTPMSDISNSSADISLRNDPFMEEASASINLYTDAQLDSMLQRVRVEDPQKLQKVNQSSTTKEELTSRITCCFSSCLDESLKKHNETYASHVKPAHFEVFEDHIIPMIKFKRYVEAVFYEKKFTMVPCRPVHVDEDFLILVYEAESLLDIFDRGVIQKHIKSIKMKNPNAKFAVWILKYDAFLQQLKNKANRLHKKQVMETLNPADVPVRKRQKKSAEEELQIHPSDVVQKLLKYEIEFDFSFQALKGISDLVEWLMSISYTLSSKHVDNFERNGEFMNLGHVKSGSTAKDCLSIMMSQVKGVTEQRAKSFVTNGDYTCIGDVFQDVLRGVDFTRKKLLRADHVKILERLMKATDGNQTIS